MMDIYTDLQAEDPRIAILIARHVARHDIAVEEALRRFGESDRHSRYWDALLGEVSDVLDEFAPRRPFRDGDRVVEGRLFRVRLPEGAEA